MAVVSFESSIASCYSGQPWLASLINSSIQPPFAQSFASAASALWPSPIAATLEAPCAVAAFASSSPECGTLASRPHSGPVTLPGLVCCHLGDPDC